MKKKLAKLTRNIVAGYRPDVIVLLETKDQEKGGNSHLDLVILKETTQPPPQRRAEVETLVAEEAGSLIDVVVYNPDELQYLYSIGNPFIHRIMQEGRLLYMKKATAMRIEDAREEFESAKVLYEHDRHKAACYHSLRTIEKGLHAMIMSKAKSPETPDDIVELYNTANAIGFKTGLSVEDIVFVGAFSKHKYPVEEALLPPFKPSREDAERALDSARRLVEKLAAVKIR